MPKPIIIHHGGKSLTMDEWCEEKGISKSALYLRWIKYNKPSVVDGTLAEKLFEKPRKMYSGRVEATVILLPDNVTMTYRQLEKIAELRLQSIKCKARKQGYVLHRDDLKVKGVGTSALERATRLAACPEYLDPSWLPNVPFADLEHLSDEENTGAGKGEIPDEEWCAIKMSMKKTSPSKPKYVKCGEVWFGSINSLRGHRFFDEQHA
jgi:hypothetical protein